MLDDTFDYIDDESAGAYFGRCPHCKRWSGCLTVRGDHWYYCEDHETKWLADRNLWKNLGSREAGDGKVTATILAEYFVVQPVNVSVGMIAQYSTVAAATPTIRIPDEQLQPLTEENNKLIKQVSDMKEFNGYRSHICYLSTDNAKLFLKPRNS